MPASFASLVSRGAHPQVPCSQCLPVYHSSPVRPSSLLSAGLDGLRRAHSRAQASLPSPTPGPVSVPVPVHVPACLGLSCIELALTALPCLASPGVPHVCAAMWVLGCVDKRQVPQSTYKPTQRSTTELPVPIKAGMLSSLRPAVWPVFSPLTEPVQNKWFRSWTYWVAQPVDILPLSLALGQQVNVSEGLNAVQ